MDPQASSTSTARDKEDIQSKRKREPNEEIEIEDFDGDIPIEQRKRSCRSPLVDNSESSQSSKRNKTDIHTKWKRGPNDEVEVGTLANVTEIPNEWKQPYQQPMVFISHTNQDGEFKDQTGRKQDGDQGTDCATNSLVREISLGTRSLLGRRRCAR